MSHSVSDELLERLSVAVERIADHMEPRQVEVFEPDAATAVLSLRAENKRLREAAGEGAPFLDRWLSCEKAWDALRDDNVRLREAAVWVLHAVSGVSKDGGPVSLEEEQEAYKSLKAALSGESVLLKGKGGRS